MTKKILPIARIVFVLAVPALIISGVVNIFIGSTSLYKYGFNKYNISQVTHISKDQLDEVAVAMSGYLKGQSNTPQISVNIRGEETPLYNSKELTHLADVRGITDVFRIVLIASIILLLAVGVVLYITQSAGTLIKSLSYGAILTLLFTGIVVIWAIIDFDSLFYLFHILSFNNDLWLLDPTRDYLIMMFPQGFFRDAALMLIGTIILGALLLLVASRIMQKRFTGKPGNA